jgi:hypothetical protein
VLLLLLLATYSRGKKKQELDKTLEEAAYVAEKETLARAFLSTMKRNFEVLKLEAEV